MIQEQFACGEVQANTSSTAPTLSVITAPSVPVSQIQLPAAPTVPDTAPAIPDNTSTSVTSAPARSVSVAMATPSQPIRGSTTASSMDSGPSTLLCQLMSNTSSRILPNSSQVQDIVTTEFHGGKYQIRRINSTNCFTQHEATHVHHGALVDSGANGGIAGSDIRILLVPPHAFVDITGVGGVMLQSLPIVQCASVVETVDEGPIVLIMSQYAHKPDSKSIHSKSQVEHFSGIVNDSSHSTGGQQLVIMHEGYTIPLHVCIRLFYMDMVPASEHDMDLYPHGFFTADSPWNPDIVDEEFFLDPNDSLLDHPDVRDRRDACDPILDLSLLSRSLPFASLDCTITQEWHAAALDALSIMSQTMKHHLPDLDALLPNFGWVSKERICSTLEMTSQHYKADQRIPMRKHFRSRFPAANVC